MTQNWLHAAFVHIPVLGFPLAAIILGWALKTGKAEPRKFGEALVFLSALIGFLAYFTGPGAYSYLESLGTTQPGYGVTLSPAWTELVELHAIIGRVYFMELVILLVLLLIQYLNRLQGSDPGRVGQWIILGLVVALALTGLFTASEGGKIRRFDWVERPQNALQLPE